MTQHEELIADLRKNQDCEYSAGESCWMSSRMTEAADALESQSREIAALKEQEAQLCTLYGLADAECKRLRKDAELWRWAITIGENQCMNFLDVYDNWDGQDSFEDAAIAAKGGA